MTRKGQLSNPIPVAILLGGVAVILILGAVYTAVVVKQAGLTTNKLYTQNMAGEEVVNAPCATVSRGVFYRSAVLSGDFRCLNPRTTLYLKFNLEKSTTVLKVTSRSGEAAVKEIDVRTADTGGGGTPAPHSGFVGNIPNAVYHQRYTVLVYDSKTGDMKPATLSIGVGL
ncbi:MAG: hypothetical protein SVQ76_01220 [Candidatus Nanohaloarchaea archaeon]|nr:hypothetical protein [Candidatus Nanohaloarchaea archaeon]